MAQSRQNSRLVMAILLALCTIVLMMQGIGQIAYASSENSFDTTNVLDDLLSSTIDGKPFDLKDYPYDEKRDAAHCEFYRVLLLVQIQYASKLRTLSADL